MGAGAYEIAAFFNFFLTVLIAARNFDAALRTLSKGIAVGFVFLFAGVIYHVHPDPWTGSPMPAGIIFGAITAWALYVAFGTKDPEVA